MKASSCVKALGWDRRTKEILVTFHSGQVVAYKALGTWEYATLHRVKSPGTYYNRHLRGREGVTVVASCKARQAQEGERFPLTSHVTDDLSRLFAIATGLSA